MNCSKCGTSVKKNDQYCENCGTKISKSERLKKTSGLSNLKTKFNGISIKKKITFCAFLLVILILVVIYEIMAYFNSSSYKAIKYFEAVIASDSEKIYEYLNVDASTFVTESLLKEKIESLGAVSSYNLESVKESDNSAVVTFTYKLENSDREYVAMVSLTKDEQKNYLLFDNWEVNSGQLATEVVIKVPTSSTVTLDSISIDNYLDKDASLEGFDIYTIPVMIKGEYNIKIKLENGVEVEDTINVESGNVYSISNIELTDTIETSIETKTVDDLDYLYTSALQNTNFSDMESTLTYKDASLDDLENSYKSLKRNITNSLVSLKAIDFTDASVVSTTYDNDGNLQVTLDVTYNYTSSYTNSSETITYNGNSYESRIVVTLEYVDSEYKINNIHGLFVNYPVKR